MEVDISDKVRACIKYGLLALLAVIFLCVGGAWVYQSRHRTLSLVGAEVAGPLVQVRARAAGTIVELSVGDGETVKQGQVLAKLQVKVSPEQIEQLASNLARSKRTLEQIREGTVTVQPVSGGGPGDENARARLESMQKLYDMGAVSAKERDEAAAAYEASAAGTVSYQTITIPGSPEAVRRAELQVRQAESALASAQQASGATELTAPVDGVAYLADSKQGSEVHPGDVVFRIGNAERLWLEAYALPSQHELFYIGQKVSYTLGGHDFVGSVTEIITPQENGAKEAKETAQGTEGARPANAHADKLTLRISIPVQDEVRVRPAERTTAKISLGE